MQPGPMTTSPDPRPLFSTALATARAAIEGIGADQFDAPTPCENFDVRTLAAHLVSVAARVTALGAGTEPMAVPTVTPGIADVDLVTAFTAAAERAEAAWADDAVLDRMMTLPWAQAPGRAMIGTFTERG